MSSNAAAQAGHHDQRVQTVGVGDRRHHDLALEFAIGQVVPGRRRGPAVLLEHLLVVRKAGRDEADADRLRSAHLGDVVDVVEDRSLGHLIAIAQRDRLVHGAVVEEHDVELLLALLGL